MTGEDSVGDRPVPSDETNMDWPVFSIRHTYCPEDVAQSVSFEPNELVMYDASSDIGGRWISASYGSYTPISDVR